MRPRLVITEDILTWYGADFEQPPAEICLVRRRTGELQLFNSIEVPQVTSTLTTTGKATIVNTST